MYLYIANLAVIYLCVYLILICNFFFSKLHLFVYSFLYIWINFKSIIISRYWKWGNFLQIVWDNCYVHFIGRVQVIFQKRSILSKVMTIFVRQLVPAVAFPDFFWQEGCTVFAPIALIRYIRQGGNWVFVPRWITTILCDKFSIILISHRIIFMKIFYLKFHHSRISVSNPHFFTNEWHFSSVSNNRLFVYSFSFIWTEKLDYVYFSI